MTELTEDQLLAAIGSGDQVAFSIFYDRVAPRVLELVRRRTADIRLADEVFQGVFLDVWRQAPRFDSALGSAGEWVSALAGRHTRETLRAAQ